MSLCQNSELVVVKDKKVNSNWHKLRESVCVCVCVFKGNLLAHETEKFKVSTRLIKPGPRGSNSYLQNSIFLHLSSAFHGVG